MVLFRSADASDDVVVAGGGGGGEATGGDICEFESRSDVVVVVNEGGEIGLVGAGGGGGDDLFSSDEDVAVLCCCWSCCCCFCCCSFIWRSFCSNSCILYLVNESTATGFAAVLSFAVVDEDEAADVVFFSCDHDDVFCEDLRFGNGVFDVGFVPLDAAVALDDD